MLRLIMEQGNGVTELTHRSTVNDGSWHNLTVIINSQLVKLTLDGASQMKKSSQGGQKHIDLTDRNIHIPMRAL